MANPKGFTLIELLTVIAIIGLISAAAMFALNNVKGRARDAKRASDVDQIGKALDLYINQTGNSYPIQPIPQCIDGNDAVSVALTEAGLISVPIVDPVFSDQDRCYLYVSDADGTEYRIRYYLETNSVAPAGFHMSPF